MDSIPPQKQCAKCLNLFPATTEYFYANKSYKYDVTSYCKKCYRAYKQEHADEKRAYDLAHVAERRAYRRAYAEANAAKIRAHQRAYYQAHKQEHAGERRAYHQAYYQAHLEERRAANRAYCQEHAAKIRAHGKAYLQARPEQRRAYGHAYRARKQGNGGTHTHEDIRKQYANQKGKCYYCHKKVGKTYDVDHVIPLSKGGSNAPSNLVIACHDCNLHKSDKIVRLL